jgi:AcrR family transcriptional regulator
MQMFISRGFEAAAMTDIAEAAGVSRATLFNYFPGKPALLQALGEDLEQRLIGALQHYRNRHAAAPAALEALFVHAGQVLEQTDALTRLVLMEEAGATGFPALLGEFETLARKGQQTGHWRSDAGPELLAETVFLGFLSSLLGWCRRPDRQTAVELVERARGLNLLLAVSATR